MCMHVDMIEWTLYGEPYSVVLPEIGGYRNSKFCWVVYLEAPNTACECLQAQLGGAIVGELTANLCPIHPGVFDLLIKHCDVKSPGAFDLYGGVFDQR